MGRRQKQRERREANFDPDPPRCGNCRNFGYDKERQVLWCSWLAFQPPAIGVCDMWRGRDGTSLEPPQRSEHA